MDHPASSPAAVDHGSPAQADFFGHVKRYLVVGCLEIVMVCATVGLSLVRFGSSKLTIAAVLLAAAVNAVVVAAILMHLKAESRTVWRFLYFTGAFFFILFFLTLLYWSSPIMGSEHTHH